MIGYGGVLYCTVLYCTVLYCTAALDLQMSVCVCHLTISQQPDLYTLYCTVQYSRAIVLYCTVLSTLLSLPARNARELMFNLTHQGTY